MKQDPTIERIRRIRHEISEECKHDPKKLVGYYMKYQQKFHGKVIKKHKVAAPLKLER